MNEFIVWDNKENRFPDVNNFVIDSAGNLCNLNLEMLNDSTYEVFWSMGKADINNNKIYADCSIVEFNILDSTYVGFFKYNSDRTRYEIEISKRESILYDGGIKNMRIIDTIQENKLGYMK